MTNVYSDRLQAALTQLETQVETATTTTSSRTPQSGVNERSISEALASLRAYEARGHVEDLEKEIAPVEPVSPFEHAVRSVMYEIGTMIIAKNKSYGNSIFDPVRIFSRAHPLDQLWVRIDDKLSRFRHAQSWPGDDNIRDLIGYLALFLVGQKQGARDE